MAIIIGFILATHIKKAGINFLYYSICMLRQNNIQPAMVSRICTGVHVAECFIVDSMEISVAISIFHF